MPVACGTKVFQIINSGNFDSLYAPATNKSREPCKDGQFLAISNYDDYEVNYKLR